MTEVGSNGTDQLNGVGPCGEQQHIVLSMPIEPGLLAQQISAGKSKTTGLAEQHRQSVITALHRLKVESLPYRALRTFEAELLHK